MPRKKAKKRDFTKSSGNRASLVRIQQIHFCINNTFLDDEGKTRCYNVRDIQNHFHNECGYEKPPSIKTIRRDIRLMRDDWNMEIEFDKSRNGFRYTVPPEKLPLIQANEGDLFGFMLFQQMLRHYEGTPLYGQLSNTMDKITNQLSGELSVSLDDLSKSVAHRDTKVPKIELENLRVISTAVISSQQLTIKYKRPAHEPEARTVDPYQCLNLNGTWYLFGFDHLREAIRSFKVVRIRGAGLTGKSFVRPPDFNVDDYIDWGLMRGKREYDVVVDFIPEVADFIREKQFHPSQRITDYKDGHIRVSWHLSDYREFRSWVLGWGAAATVVLPKELQDSMHNIGERIAENHK